MDIYGVHFILNINFIFISSFVVVVVAAAEKFMELWELPKQPPAFFSPLNLDIHSVSPASYSTLDPDEVRKFQVLADKWWDTRGEFALLHAMNELRVPFVRSVYKSYTNTLVQCTQFQSFKTTLKVLRHGSKKSNYWCTVAWMSKNMMGMNLVKLCTCLTFISLGDDGLFHY